MRREDDHAPVREAMSQRRVVILERYLFDSVDGRQVASAPGSSGSLRARHRHNERRRCVEEEGYLRRFSCRCFASSSFTFSGGRFDPIQNSPAGISIKPSISSGTKLSFSSRSGL